ncbi:hypothetical protein PAAG_12490 [Paracoccidioides lutzii Pb01]|uniref:Uncharacterized protein n=1 Tax=Paracoccidioides lutzii (strain ATCC MYA-826 / Pb01) TaxID=502779 RepID=A0A0A2V3U7_PARBA|nr:hypothetical protein PAAG_12490 [Paracoccidioides lutzii Pb01]KGQ00825.1 hypothetical protein PAAG_12490 [Paracoccidioides lutzii Pb01]
MQLVTCLDEPELKLPIISISNGGLQALKASVKILGWSLSMYSRASAQIQNSKDMGTIWQGLHPYATWSAQQNKLLFLFFLLISHPIAFHHSFIALCGKSLQQNPLQQLTVIISPNLTCQHNNFDISFSATVSIADMLFKLVSPVEEPGTFILIEICGQSLLKIMRMRVQVEDHSAARQLTQLQLRAPQICA